MIIYLDPTDELNVIIHQIRQASASELRLVVPKENLALRNQINVELLAKYAKSSNKKIAVQSSDPLVLKYLEANGIEAIRDESAATTDDDEDSSPSLDQPSLRRRKQGKRSGYDRLIVILIIVAAILGLTYYHLPKVVISVTPSVLDFAKSIQVPLGELDGVEKATAEVTLTRKTPATGRKIVGISPARGVITLVNQSQTEVLVKKDTLVETGSGIQFKTVADVLVPGVATQYFMDIPTGLSAGRAEVEIVAVESGSQGNVATGRIGVIHGYDLELRNFDPTTGGEDITLQVVTEADIERAQALVIRDGEQELKSTLFAKQGDLVLIEDTLTLNVQWGNMSEIDAETSEVSVSGLCHGEVYLVDMTVLGEQMASLLTAQVPAGYVINPDTLVLDDLILLDATAEVELKIHARALIQGRIDPLWLATELAGKDQGGIEAVLAANPVIGELIIESGAKDKLPNLPRWLKINVEEPSY